MTGERQAPVETRCSGKRFEVTAVSGGTSPYVELSVGRRKGFFLLDYGTTESSLAGDFYQAGGSDSADIRIEKISLPSFSSGRFRISKYGLAATPPGGQLGIIGTDFLSLLTADFSFRHDRRDVALSALPCDREVLRARGLVPVRQKGFFSGDLRKVDVVMPNVPVLFVNIGGVFSAAQIDTGYDDRVMPPSIDINDALYGELVAAGIALRRKGTSSLVTCHGVVTNDVYAVVHAEISLRTEDDREIRPLAGAALIRKKANGCGGIADMASPMAQLGMSVVAGLGSVVFDPARELVWVGGRP
ncbi:hypothetical protein [Hyphomicrobium sp.]|uniref:hypothetical protein n=1 Tax=Hyphomicrobium sp. TaxID=82 RepID=UPI003561D89C